MVIILDLLADELIRVISSVAWLWSPPMRYRPGCLTEPALSSGRESKPGVKFQGFVLFFLVVQLKPMTVPREVRIPVLGRLHCNLDNLGWEPINTLWGGTEPQNRSPRLGGSDCLKLMTPVSLTPCIPEVLLSNCSFLQLYSLLRQKP